MSNQNGNSITKDQYEAIVTCVDILLPHVADSDQAKLSDILDILDGYIIQYEDENVPEIGTT